MNFLLSDELVEFSKSLQKFFSASDRLSSAYDRDWDEGRAARWNAFVALGAPLSIIPEKYDGLGFGQIAAQLVIEQSARALSPLPVFENIALGLVPLMLAADESAKSRLLPSVASGEMRLTGAFQQLFSADSPLVVVTAAKGKGSDKASGSLRFVPSLETSSGLLFLGRPFTKGRSKAASGPALYLLELNDSTRASLEVKELSTIDIRRSYSSITLKESPVLQLSGAVMSEDDCSWLAQSISLFAASEMVGAADYLHSLTLDYVKTRKQFGKAIGSFQAVQHQLADMYLVLEQASALTRFAAWALDSDRSQALEACRAAKGFCSEMLPRLAEQALQLHGGIGFTFEYQLHLFLRRICTNAQLYGSSAEHYQQIAKAHIA